MMIESQDVKRVIIEKDSIVLEFDSARGDNMLVWGKTADGRTAIYLSDETDVVRKSKASQEANRLIRILAKDNPGETFELVMGMSIFAPRGRDALLPLAETIEGFLEKAIKGEINEGYNQVKLSEFMPMANIGWIAMWTVTDSELNDLNTNRFRSQKHG